MGKTSSLKTILEQIKLLQKDKKIRLVITMAAVLLSAFIQAWAIQVFVRPAEIISGGFSGAAMLIERVGSLKGLTIPMQVTMILLNIPVALMCCRGISVRFTVVSLLQVVFGSIFLQIFSFQPIFTDEILNVIFGGVIYGTSIVIALRGNASTGGTDFIALYVSNKTGKSIWSYVFFGNALMYCVYGVIFGWKFAGYSIIFQFISTHMISAFHHRYDLVTLQATTEKGPEVVALYIKHFRHGISCVEAAIKEHNPDVVIDVGQAGGRACVTVEKVGINLADARIPDNAGEQPSDEPLQADGPTAYFATIPVKAMVQNVREHGLPCHVSFTAGTYVCNCVMYNVLHLCATKYPNIRAGFIHVPFACEQVVGKASTMASMPLETIAKSLEYCIEAVVTNKEEVKEAMGTTH